jgi:hypothetical protein
LVVAGEEKAGSVTLQLPVANNADDERIDWWKKAKIASRPAQLNSTSEIGANNNQF